MTLRNSSPLTCPSVSLTALNRSTSMNSSPTWPAVRSRRRCSSPSRTPRLARPVSGSWVAWNLSWRSVWRWRVMSLNEHTTPSMPRRAAQPQRLGVGGDPAPVPGAVVDADHHVQLGHARAQGDGARVLVGRQLVAVLVHHLQAREAGRARRWPPSMAARRACARADWLTTTSCPAASTMMTPSSRASTVAAKRCSAARRSVTSRRITWKAGCAVPRGAHAGRLARSARCRRGAPGAPRPSRTPRPARSGRRSG